MFSFVRLYVDRTRWQELSVEPRLRDTKRCAGGCLGAMLCTRAWLKSWRSGFGQAEALCLSRPSPLLAARKYQGGGPRDLVLKIKNVFYE